LRLNEKYRNRQKKKGKSTNIKKRKASVNEEQKKKGKIVVA
jgi:hypothetical protein